MRLTVVAGTSAGGHLSLMTGLLRASDGFDVECQSGTPMVWTGVDRAEPRVAAILAPVQGQVNAEEKVSGPIREGADLVQSASGFTSDLRGRLLRAAFRPPLGRCGLPLVM